MYLEIRKSVTAIKELREFATGERVSSFPKGGTIAFIILGRVQFGEFAKAMLDLTDFRAADLGRPWAKSGVAWMEGEELSCSLG